MTKEKVISLISPKFKKGIAHRGLFDDSCTENGVKAFKRAIEHDIPFEFDIHLTLDGELIVCHDENLVRTTGKEGIIEHLTSQEIRDNYRLLDGGVVPTLKEVIELNNERVPMVIELKVFEKNYKQIAAKLKEFLPLIKDKKNAMIISFDPRSLYPLRKEGFIRSLLLTHTYQYSWVFRHIVESIDIEDCLLEEKRYQKYAKKHYVNVWTIETEAQIDKVLPYVDTITFQHMDPAIVDKKLSTK